MRKSRIPIVEFSKYSYSIECPDCGKPITLDELENFDFCSNCATYWNKWAYSLIPFYRIYSKKLLNEIKNEIYKG